MCFLLLHQCVQAKLVEALPSDLHHAELKAVEKGLYKLAYFLKDGLTVGVADLT
jgi:hypothetical protein